ncbi:hypothetical protein BDR04DRAFT_1230636 [Suillus decipiens]|nr:hypothetical protein BDR04DRAFT_1230636 [Suillus decipiens]
MYTLVSTANPTDYGQLYFPLSNLVDVYHAINQSLVDTEKLLHLLNEPTEVVDEPSAKGLVVSNAKLNLPLLAKAEQVKAILFPLYRLYDLQPGSGRIVIEEQDIRAVMLSGLRRVISVVRQDPVLFNIWYL